MAEALSDQDSSLPKQALDQSGSAQRVILYITRPEETKNCNFWIGLYKKGSLNPQELYEQPSIDKVYSHAVEEGIADEEPILISNTEKSPTEQFYLLPVEDFKRSTKSLIANIYDTLTALAPQRAGFYFSPELIDKDQCLMLLRQVLLSCQKCPTKEFYLFAGQHGVNSVLNTALDVRSELAGTLDVLVFH